MKITDSPKKGKYANIPYEHIWNIDKTYMLNWLANEREKGISYRLKLLEELIRALYTNSTICA